MKYSLAPVSEVELGRGAYGWVYKAKDVATGKAVAIKQSRVSLRIKRPTLQHEARILKLLQGHSSVPIVYGYGRMKHFEVLGMEFLGRSVEECKPESGGTSVSTVIRLLRDTFSGLHHIHSHGISHRDIKPENILCIRDRSFPVKIIDFGIAKPNPQDAPKRYDPLRDRLTVVGTFYWASLNSHNGVDLRPRDDLESLAYTALYLLRGSLPWKPRPHSEHELISQEIIRLMKMECTGRMLADAEGFPAFFGELLDYSRSLNHDQLPDYTHLGTQLASLADFDFTEASEDPPTDWTPCEVPTPLGPHLTVPEVKLPPRANREDDDDTDSIISDDSYFGRDIDIWEIQGERDENLSLPLSQEEELDKQLAPMLQVAG